MENAANEATSQSFASEDAGEPPPLPHGTPPTEGELNTSAPKPPSFARPSFALMRGNALWGDWETGPSLAPISNRIAVDCCASPMGSPLSPPPPPPSSLPEHEPIITFAVRTGGVTHVVSPRSRTAESRGELRDASQSSHSDLEPAAPLPTEPMPEVEAASAPPPPSFSRPSFAIVTGQGRAAPLLEEPSPTVAAAAMGAAPLPDEPPPTDGAATMAAAPLPDEPPPADESMVMPAAPPPPSFSRPSFAVVAGNAALLPDEPPPTDGAATMAAAPLPDEPPPATSRW